MSTLPSGPPNGYFVIVPPAGSADPIDLAGMIDALLASWKLIVALAVLGAAVMAGISLVLPKTYRAAALVAPVNVQGNSGSSLGALRNQFGGLAALAGIDLGSGGGRTEESLATFQSTGFARDFIVQQNLLPLLFAADWDAQRRAWKTAPPSMETAVKKFTGDVLSIADDKKTGLVTVTVTWASPQLAADWANRLVETVNERLRAEAKSNADRSVQYLNEELGKATVVELRQAIYRLIQDQVNNAMLANVQREYAFRFIDRAVAPETRASPKRALLTAAGGVGGAVCGVLFVLVRRFLRERRRTGAHPAATLT